MNTALLKSVMALYGDTMQDLAKYLGITPNSVSNKIHERGAEFKQGEILKIKERYNLTPDQIDNIFFD